MSELAGPLRALVRNERVLWRRCLDGALVWADTMSEPVMLPAPGDTIWEVLATPRSTSELVADLAECFDTPPVVIEQDLRPFLAELARHGLLDETGRAAESPL